MKSKTSPVNPPFKLEQHFVFPIKFRPDKYDQQFQHIVQHDKHTKKFIDDTRKAGQIDLNDIKTKIRACHAILLTKLMSGPEFQVAWLELEDYANAKIDILSLRRILRATGSPANWEAALIWYILTGEIKIVSSPGTRCEVKIDNERQKVILELSPDATIRDIKQKWQLIDEIQQDFVGYRLKKKHSRDDRKFKKQISIAKDQVKFSNKERSPKSEKDSDGVIRKVGINEQKERERYRLVKKHNPKAVDNKDEQKKEEARQRQVKRRHKKFLSE